MQGRGEEPEVVVVKPIAAALKNKVGFLFLSRLLAEGGNSELCWCLLQRLLTILYGS